MNHLIKRHVKFPPRSPKLDKKNEESSPSSTPVANPPQKQPNLPLNALIIQYLIILRIINAFTINTFFQPDEYFQALEPAHSLAYGYGELTWEWFRQIRSFNYPFVFYLSYKLSDLLQLGDIGVLLVPKMVQGIISAISEYRLYVFSQKLFNHQHELWARTVLLLSVISSFNWFCFTRTFSNTFELNMTIIALSYWPWEVYYSRAVSLDLSVLKSLVFASLAVIVRPTNVLIWLVLGCHLLMSVSNSTRLKLAGFSVAAGGSVLIVNIIVDWYYYNSFVFPFWNFLKFNVVDSFADFYGTNIWHFHFSQSLPFVLTTYLPTFIYGSFFCDFKFKKLFLSVIFVNMLFFSLLNHKEFRFIYSLMPFFLVFTAHGFLKLYHYKPSSRAMKALKTTAIYGTFMINLAIGVLLTQVQERGVIDVINYLKFDPDVDSIGFLTPCHSTPLHSYLHRSDLKDKIWYLSCEPPSSTMVNPEIYTADAIKDFLANYKDESDIFYEDPKMFLDVNFPPFKREFRTKGRVYNYEWPTHLVFFEPLEPFMKKYLQSSNYEQCERFFNSYFHWDSRRSGDVIVYCKWPWD